MKRFLLFIWAIFASKLLFSQHYAYFTNPNGWDEVYCYVWDSKSYNKILGPWPGTSASKQGDVYEAVIPSGFTPDEKWMIIWNNGGNGAQTGDLFYVDHATYDMNGIVGEDQKCGENLTWTFNESTGELTISGTGDMSEWGSEVSVPWDSYRYKIRSVSLPDGVTSIGVAAFSNCTGLTAVTIPNSVTSIGKGAFSGCSGLTSIVVESGNTTFDSRDNCNAIIETASNELIVGCQNTVIPSSVTSIGREAFSGCSGLTSITIPESVTDIWFYAFGNCTGLTAVTIPNSVTSIGREAFYSCSDLTSITIPESVTNIGDYAFYGCKKLKTVYNLSSLVIVKGSEEYGYVAYYADNVYNKQCKLSVSSSNILQGTVSATFGGVTLSNDTTLWTNTDEPCSLVLTAVPATGFQFNGWNDGNMENPRTITLTQDTALVATFGTKMCTLTIVSNIDEAAVITGAGTYEYGTAVSCVVDVMSGYRFVSWGNGEIYNPYKFKIYDDMTLDAIFEKDGGFAPSSEVGVTVTGNYATFTWPVNPTASSYTLTISKDGVVFCTLTFNSLGQLVGMAFAPTRDGTNLAPASAESTAQGYAFVVSGLDRGVYNYTFTVNDSEDNVIETFTGSFVAEEVATAINEMTVNKYVDTTTKFLRDGQLLIQRDGKTYNMHGAVVNL